MLGDYLAILPIAKSVVRQFMAFAEEKSVKKEIIVNALARVVSVQYQPIPKYNLLHKKFMEPRMKSLRALPMPTGKDNYVIRLKHSMSFGEETSKSDLIRKFSMSFCSLHVIIWNV